MTFARLNLIEKTTIAESILTTVSTHEGLEGPEDPAAIERYVDTLIAIELHPQVLATLVFKVADRITYMTGRDQLQFPNIWEQMRQRMSNADTNPYLAEFGLSLRMLNAIRERRGEQVAWKTLPSNVIPFPVHRTRRPGVAA